MVIKAFLYLATLATLASAQLEAWTQCGGQGWQGSTSCAAGHSCVAVNSYYSQCTPGGVAAAPAAEVYKRAPPKVVVPTRSLQEIRNFGSNPTRVRFFIYVPDGLRDKPAILVAPHYCTGSANAIYTGTPWRTYADQYKFLVIYPQAPDSGGCWDVHTTATLTHDAGGDSLGVISAIKWTADNWTADLTRIFSAGTSSGAMMTNVLAGAYPDILAAGSAFAGVPYGCFAGPGLWNNQCANGQLSKTADAWANQVRSGYPGYNGTYPRMQLWHGTQDTTLSFRNHAEAIKQWTAVHGVSQTPTATRSNWPVNGWTRSDYGPNVMGIVANNVPHNIPIQGAQVMEWLGLNVQPV